MNSFFQKVQPFLEHILVGLGYAGMGYLFFWTFNTSFLAFFGMMAICFGGLKLLIGLIIYGAWLFAVLFRPEELKKKEEEAFLKEQSAPLKEGPGNFLAVIRPHWAVIIEVAVLILGLLTVALSRTGMI